MSMSLFWVMPIMLLYRLIDLGTPLFSISECSWDSSSWDVSLFQSLAPEQELVPPQTRDTVTTVAINVIGICFSVTASGLTLDCLIDTGVERP